jgi:hypothetical protein
VWGVTSKEGAVIMHRNVLARLMKIYSWVEYIPGTQGGGKPTIRKTDVGKPERAGIDSPAHGVPEDGAHQQVPAEKKELHAAGTAGLSFQVLHHRLEVFKGPGDGGTRAVPVVSFFDAIPLAQGGYSIRAQQVACKNNPTSSVN